MGLMNIFYFNVFNQFFFYGKGVVADPEPTLCVYLPEKHEYLLPY